MKEVTTPVLLKKGNKVLRLLNITYGCDDSIYIIFPRNKSYILNKISEKKYEDTFEYVEFERKLSKLDEEYIAPKISFHPLNNTIHVKSVDDKRVNSAEYPLHNFSDDKRFSLFTFAQIIFPDNYEVFDEYNKPKYKDLIVVEDIINWEKEIINLEIFVHTQNSAMTEDGLPYSKNRNLKSIVTYFGDHKYSCSVVISTLPKGDSSSNITVLINTEECSVLYSLDPIEK